ncbi:hypothetical protein [Tranquillimonas rosea]|uniref:hypothetical protein n=1 Tax=Tranquillimonas rosea TaxID=641238 RepID=UPI003BAD2E6D
MATFQPKWMRRDYMIIGVLAIVAIAIASYFGAPYFSSGGSVMQPDAPAATAPAE